MNNNFYLLAAQLPLLQGIGADVLLDWQSEHVIRQVTLEVDDDIIAGQGEPCRTLMFLAEGKLERISRTDRWTLTETLEAPAVIEEEALWSLSRCYHHSYRATGTATLLVVSKEHVMRTMMRNEIFRINMLARLSARLEREESFSASPQQASQSKGSNSSKGSKEDKIMSFVESISTTPSYPKSLKIKMTTLASILEERRLTVSEALHGLEKKGIVELQRENIKINEYFSEKHKVRNALRGATV